MLYNCPVVPHVKKQKHHSNVKECLRISSFVFYLQHISSPALSSGLIRAALSVSRMNMAISHIALEHVSQ